MMYPSRLLTARPTRSAAMTASVPEFEYRTNSADGTMEEIFWATSYSNSVARAKTPPISIPSLAA